MPALRAGRGPALAARAAGFALVALALVALGGAFWRPAAPLNQSYESVALPSATPTGTAARGAVHLDVRPAPPIRLTLPNLDVSAPVVPVSVASGGGLDVPNDPNVLGWWSSGARPGDRRGSVLIDGHVDSATQGVGVFAHLRELQPGDPIITESASGELRHYRVTSVQQFPKATLPAETLFNQEVQERLVLITCGGPFNRDERQYPDNVVVLAEPDAAQSDLGLSSRTRDRTLDSAMTTPSSSISRSQTRRAVCRCLRGASRSASSEARTVAACGPITGATRTDVFRGGGTASANA